MGRPEVQVKGDPHDSGEQTIKGNIPIPSEVAAT